MNNVADFKDPNDSLGRTYREVNNATDHKLKLGQLVEVEDDGIRLFITKLSRDCDGTPLYSLGMRQSFTHGYTEECLKAI